MLSNKLENQIVTCTYACPPWWTPSRTCWAQKSQGQSDSLVRGLWRTQPPTPRMRMRLKLSPSRLPRGWIRRCPLSCPPCSQSLWNTLPPQCCLHFLELCISIFDLQVTNSYHNCTKHLHINSRQFNSYDTYTRDLFAVVGRGKNPGQVPERQVVSSSDWQLATGPQCEEDLCYVRHIGDETYGRRNLSATERIGDKTYRKTKRVRTKRIGTKCIGEQ